MYTVLYILCVSSFNSLFPTTVTKWVQTGIWQI
jgi:hypothetical protein